MQKLYEIFSGEELKIAEKIQQRRLQILVHSYLYYDLDTNIVSDDTWAKWGKELVELQNKYPELSNKIFLYEYFKDFDPSSGAFLPTNLPFVQDIGQRLLYIRNSKQESKKKQTKQKTSSMRLF